jgi:hypothetical protein
VDLAPEFPVLDGDSGKTAGVVIFLSSLIYVAPLQTAYAAKHGEEFFCS